MYVCMYKRYQVICEVGGKLFEVVWREAQGLEKVPQLLLQVRQLHAEDTRAAEQEPG